MDIMSITPAHFDKLLRLLADNCEFSNLSEAPTSDMCEHLGVDMRGLRFMFQKLMDDGLIRDLNDRGSVFLFHLSTDVWEVLAKGGCTAQFTLAAQQLRLLESEVAKLDKSVGAEHLERITNIIANIYTFFPKNLMD